MRGANSEGKAERQLLHAWKLGLFHQTTNEWMEFEAPLPADVTNLASYGIAQDTTQEEHFLDGRRMSGSKWEDANNIAPPERIRKRSTQGGTPGEISERTLVEPVVFGD